ncbi:fimbrial protein [Providencia sp. Marseille-Q8014]
MGLKRIFLLIGITLLFFTGLANAACVRMNGGISGGPIILGSKVDLYIYGLEFQPAGTQLYIESFSNANMASLMGKTLETIVFQCDITDADNIFEMYYLPSGAIDNGNYLFIANGIKYWAVRAPELSFQMFLGMNKSVDNQYDNRVSRRKIGYEVDPVNSNKINIKMKHFSGVTLEQARSTAAANSNSYTSIAGFDRGAIGFSGPGINAAQGNAGFPSAGSYLPIRMRPVGARVVSTCGLSAVQSTVNLGRHSAADIPSIPVPFSFTLKCQRGARISYGFAPEEENRVKNETNYLLLDPNLGSTATGIAIEILTSSGVRNNLLNLGVVGGQIPATNNWTRVPIPTTGAATHEVQLNFLARFVPYGGVPITPGRANSKMTIMLNAN